MVRRAAQAQGFLDPILLLSRMRRFAQPSEVIAPTELLRAGAVLHARGLMNSQAIQHNLDWIWPHWATRQFDPHDPSFVPWAFSITHINLTHRNWTAVGLPGLAEYPLVDPRGLVTPLFDGWSLDAWIVTQDGGRLVPSRLPAVSQAAQLEEGWSVVTHAEAEGLSIHSTVDAIEEGGRPQCRMVIQGTADRPGWLVLALRPYNPEGVSFIHDVELLPQRLGWIVNGKHPVRFSAAPERHGYSTYRLGDVSRLLPDVNETAAVTCDVGMATAAALFAIEAHSPRELTVLTPLPSPDRDHGANRPARLGWSEALADRARLQVPDERFQQLFDIALRTLVLHSPHDVYPGPYTYKRFWFRDAAFIIYSMLCAGLTDRAMHALTRFPSRQTPFGYFRSQDGEWDSNGQVLWILQRAFAMTDRKPGPEWKQPVQRAAEWLRRKRLSEDLRAPHAGLLPPGFSAEHLGPNDYYYWDDFWGVAGFRGAAWMMESWGDAEHARRCRHDADRFLDCIARSLAQTEARLGLRAMPASPYRRMDAGAIGSLVASYPLQSWPGDDSRVLETVSYLLKNCFLEGGFFQTMSHSGINPYLTLHVAQVLLRAGDPRCFSIIERVAELASSTGQWPEAVHPRTRGGCMGDGQHVWAAAEWVMMLRNLFVREEGDHVVLGSGLPQAWTSQPETTMAFGPAATLFGPIDIRVETGRDGIEVSWDARWHHAPASLELCVPGFPARRLESAVGTITLRRQAPLATEPAA